MTTPVTTRYRKRPVVIDAYQTAEPLDIETLEGTMHANPGDWIITGLRSEKYPCKPDIFEASYEPAITAESGQQASELDEAWEYVREHMLSEMAAGEPEGREALDRLEAAIKSASAETVEARFDEIHFLAKPCRVGFRFKGVPFDIRVPDADAKLLLRSLHENFINEPDKAERKQKFFAHLHDRETARDHLSDLRHAMGHTGRAAQQGAREMKDILGPFAGGAADTSTSMARPGTVEEIGE